MMKRLAGCLLVFIVAFSGCTEKLDEQIINDFEQVYKIVEVDKQLQQLCQNANQYELFIKVDSDVLVLNIHVENLKGFIKYFEESNFENSRSEYEIELTTSGIIVDDEGQTILPLDVLLVFNDVISNIKTYEFSKRISAIEHDVNKVIVKYPIETYYNQMHEQLVSIFGSEEMKMNFLKKVDAINEIKEINLTYEYDYNQPYKTQSRTTLIDSKSKDGIFYEIFEQCQQI